MKSLKDIKAKLPIERQARVEERAQALIQREYVLWILREQRWLIEQRLESNQEAKDGQ